MRRRGATLVVAGAALALAALASGQERATRPWPEPLAGTCELALVNARVVAPGRDPASVLLVGGGKVLAVGGDELRARIGSGTVVRDLAGACVVPGLRDAHVHLENWGALLRGRFCDLSDTKDAEKAAEKFASWVASRRAPPDTVLIGRGWHGAPPASTALLDSAAPANPAILIRQDGHSVWVNRRLLALAAVRRDVADVRGGEIGRDADGNLTGFFADAAKALVVRVVPAATPEDEEADVLAAARECARRGLVEVHDAGMDEPLERALRSLAGRGELPLRVYGMIRIRPALLDDRLAADPVVRPIGGRLTIRAVKLVADGVLGTHGARLLEPYADAPATRGYETLARPTLRRIARRCLERGYQLAVHAIGDAAVRDVLDAYETLAGADNARFRIEHVSALHPDDRPRFARLGVIASVQPGFLVGWRTAERCLGPERAGRESLAFGSLARSGAHVCFGSDVPAADCRPLLALAAAVSRQDARGAPPGGYGPAERLSPEDALRASTSEPAYAAFEEAERGELRPGLDADLTVLSDDPLELLANDPARVASVRVIGTYVAGLAP